MGSNDLWSQQQTSEPDQHHNLRKRAVIQFIVMACIASFLLFIHHTVLAVIVYSLSALNLIGGLFIPPLFLLFDRFGKFLAVVFGKVLTWVLLVPFFYLCFVPGRLIMLILGKDPMKRKLDPDAETYWMDKKDMHNTDHFKVQYR